MLVCPVLVCLLLEPSLFVNLVTLSPCQHTPHDPHLHPQTSFITLPLSQNCNAKQSNKWNKFVSNIKSKPVLATTHGSTMLRLGIHHLQRLVVSLEHLSMPLCNGCRCCFLLEIMHHCKTPAVPVFISQHNQRQDGAMSTKNASNLLWAGQTICSLGLSQERMPECQRFSKATPMKNPPLTNGRAGRFLEAQSLETTQTHRMGMQQGHALSGCKAQSH